MCIRITSFIAKYLLLTLLESLLFASQPAYAEIITVEGVGRYAIEDVNELRQAENKAETIAKRNALEQAAFDFSSVSEEQGGYLTHDEIITIIAGIIKIKDVKNEIQIEPDGTTIAIAMVTAEIDTEMVNSELEKETALHSNTNK